MIYRNRNRRQFTAVPYEIIQSNQLSLDELGLYTAMLSRPDNWEFSEFELSHSLHMTPSAIISLLTSLSLKGFTQQRRGRYGTVWDLYECPEAPARKSLPSEQAVRLIAETAKAASVPKPSVPKPETEPDPPKRTLTNEQMAQAFFDQAKKLRERNEYKKMNGVWPD